MARRVAATLIVAAALLPVVTARAQLLQRLTVASFTVSADTLQPQVGVPFHLIVLLRVREGVDHIQNLDLPILAELELLGDERQITTGRAGATYRETITVVAHQSGTMAIAPATLEAVDGRDGRSKEWYSNGLTLHVGGGPVAALTSAASIGATALRIALWPIGLIAIGLIIASVVRRPAVAVPSTPALPLVPQRSRRNELADMLVVLRATPTRPTAADLRSALWRMVGAGDGETLGDVLRRTEASSTELRSVLIAIERASFTYDADFDAAVSDACAALERAVAIS